MVHKIYGHGLDPVAAAQGFQHGLLVALQRAHTVALHPGAEPRVAPRHPAAQRQSHAQPPQQNPLSGHAAAGVLRQGFQRASLHAVQQGGGAVTGVDHALTHLVRHGPGGHIHGKTGSKFIHHRIGQRKGQQQAQRHQQPGRIDRPAAQPVAQKRTHGNHQQNDHAADDGGLQQEVEYSHAPHGGIASLQRTYLQQTISIYNRRLSGSFWFLFRVFFLFFRTIQDLLQLAQLLLVDFALFHHIVHQQRGAP